MLNTINKIWSSSDKYFIIPVLITSFSVILIISLFFFFINQLPDKLPLFYSLSWGENQLASKQQFFLLPIILILALLINSLIASQLHSAQYILKRILLLSLILLDAVILITAIKILWIFI